MARFWRLRDPAFEDKHMYIDPAEIVAVEYLNDSEKNRQYYALTLRSGEFYELTDDDGVQIMKWAESQAEAIPDVSLEMQWR